MALDSAKKSEIIAKFGTSDKDTGSIAVQITLLSAKISRLTEHLKVHKKDYHSRVGLLKSVGKRKRLMKYAKKVDLESYKKLIKALRIRDNI